ncbi:MAG: ABC transporter ATP-binding protein [Tissierellia bacterium]|nr:ABC transporter ATP-binding protein [Tissierellia bacterium]
MQGIHKVFGDNIALHDVDFHCHQGEVVCLLGENGAGKTTLMKILYGMYRKDAGEILFRGTSQMMTSPRVAISAGIQMVHQHFMLVDTMSVVDNVMIGKEPGKNLFYDRVKGHQIVESLSKEYGLKVPMNKLVRDISIGERQRVEIIKALYQGTDVLILDEPTAVLTPQEVEDLFLVIRNLCSNGKTVIIITHKLKETMAISDRIYVLRQGKMVGDRRVEETNIEELSQMMVGQAIPKSKKTRFYSDEYILKMKGVRHVDSDGVEVLKGVDLEIKKQEVLGIAGVEGNGQAELIDVLYGLLPQWSGEILFCGHPLCGKTTMQLIDEGMACIHADRQAYSIAPNLTIPYNLLMGAQDKEKYRENRFLINWKKVKEDARKILDEFDVRPRDIERNLYEFSGGNQQKFVVGRETGRNPKLLIAAHPTRGVDIMATSAIHTHLHRLKASGISVLLITSDLDELMELSDRIAVIYDGKIVQTKLAEEFSMMELGRLMGGGRQDEKAI